MHVTGMGGTVDSQIPRWFVHLQTLGKELNYIIPTSCSVSPANPFSVQTLGEDGSLENATAFLCHGP